MNAWIMKIRKFNTYRLWLNCFSQCTLCNATNINGMIMSSWIIRVIIYYVLLANVALTNYVCHYLFIGQFDWNRIISIKIKEWKKNKKDNKTLHINPKKSLKSLEILCENLINKFRFNFNCKTCQDFIGFKKKKR